MSKTINVENIYFASVTKHTFPGNALLSDSVLLKIGRTRGFDVDKSVDIHIRLGDFCDIVRNVKRQIDDDFEFASIKKKELDEAIR